MSLPTKGEQNLPTLLASMRPTVHLETFVFLTTTQPIENLPLQSLKPEMLFQEDEGLSMEAYGPTRISNPPRFWVRLSGC